MRIKSIQAKLWVSFLPMVLLFFGAMATISYYFSNQALTKSVNETAIAQINNVGQGTDEMVQNVYSLKESSQKIAEIDRVSDRRALADQGHQGDLGGGHVAHARVGKGEQSAVLRGCAGLSPVVRQVQQVNHINAAVIVEVAACIEARMVVAQAPTAGQFQQVEHVGAARLLDQYIHSFAW